MKRLVFLIVTLLSVSLVSCDNKNCVWNDQNDEVDSTAVANEREQTEYIINYLLVPNNGYLIRTIPVK